MLYLYTGGSGSGKSACAEKKILSFGEIKRIYLATMAANDAESRSRILRHRDMRREKQFLTVERYTDLGGLLLPQEEMGICILLECMSNLVANEMYAKDGAKEHTVEHILIGVKQLNSRAKELVIVTNEVFSDIPCRDGETRRYLQYLGEVNGALAEMAQEVTEVVYGIEVPLGRRKSVIRRENTVDENMVDEIAGGK